MKVLFLDESGDHDLEVIDPQYPMFVLGGVIVEQSYAEEEFVRFLDGFKLKMKKASPRYAVTSPRRNYGGAARIRQRPSVVPWNGRAE